MGPLKCLAWPFLSTVYIFITFNVVAKRIEQEIKHLFQLFLCLLINFEVFYVSFYLLSNKTLD